MFKMMTKNSQIGLTITWFGATVVIFFIMLLFITFTSLLISKKNFTFSTTQTSNDESLEIKMKLFNILNTRMDDGRLLQEWIIDWRDNDKGKDEIQKKIKEILENEGIQKYSFSTYSKKWSEIMVSKDYDFLINGKRVVSSGAGVVLFSKENKISIYLEVQNE